ncbi:unnamed protein product [Ectocarpus sp. CCAP 1310/34]|nr:unnamed protein product [Ectocarpus sp. CCAP 1310/34]
MPPRSSAGPPMRRSGRDREGVVDTAAAADWKQRQRGEQQHQSSSQFSRLARGTSVSFSAMETTAEEDLGGGDGDDDAAEPPGGSGGGGARLSRWLGSQEPLPSFFHSSAVGTASASASAADFLANSDSSSETSGSSAVSDQAMMELSAHDEGEGEEDDVAPIGIFVPALDRGATGRRGLGPSFADDADMRQRGCGDSAGGSSCTRRIGYFRALSSQCLEGLDWGDTGAHHRRERSGSEPRVSQDPPRSSGFDLLDYSTDLLGCSGAPSDREHSSTLYHQYSNEASAPPPQVLQGWKMNCVALDKRSWLEVRDKQHRYGKNLRLYFKEWDRRGKPGGSFFKWLSAAEVQLEGCPRHELESDVVHYCRPEERHNYALRLDVTPEGRAILHTAQGEPVNCGPSAWLFVLRDQTLFATGKKTDPPRFHHSSFFGGGYVEAAGMLVAEEGVLKTLYPHSGHYRPTNQHLRVLLKFLNGLGVDLDALEVDAQRVHKVARPDKRASYPRVRKMDNPFMVSARYLLDFFEAKYLAWSSCHFDELYLKVNERHERLHQHLPDAELPKFRFGSGPESDSDSSNCWRGSSSTSGGGGSVGRSDAGGGGGFAALKPPAGGAEGEGGGGGGGGGRPAEENSAGGESGSLAPSCPPGPP